MLQNTVISSIWVWTPPSERSIPQRPTKEAIGGQLILGLDPLQGEAYLRARQKIHLGGSDKDRTAQKMKLEPKFASVCIVVQVVVITVKHALKVLL